MLRAVSAVPVIIASARDDDPSLVRALDAGADDYVVKPFSSAQLDARVRAVLRRVETGRERRPTVTVGGLVLDLAGRRVHLDGREVDLTPREFDLLAHLAERPGEVVTKRDLLVEVWRQPWGGSDKTVDVHLSWLRRKLGETAAEPRYLDHRARCRRTPDCSRRRLLTCGAACSSPLPPPSRWCCWRCSCRWPSSCAAMRWRTGSPAPPSRSRPSRPWSPAGTTRARCRPTSTGSTETAVDSPRAPRCSTPTASGSGRTPARTPGCSTPATPGAPAWTTSPAARRSWCRSPAAATPRSRRRLP